MFLSCELNRQTMYAVDETIVEYIADVSGFLKALQLFKFPQLCLPFHPLRIRNAP